MMTCTGQCLPIDRNLFVDLIGDTGIEWGLRPQLWVATSARRDLSQSDRHGAKVRIYPYADSVSDSVKYARLRVCSRDGLCFTKSLVRSDLPSRLLIRYISEAAASCHES
jgi:hypothetical protein